MAEEKMVVIAEDHPDTLTIVTRRLERAGYKTIPTGDGLSALMAVESLPPGANAVLLTDGDLPGMNGPQIVQELRSRGNAIPAAIHSGNDARCGEAAKLGMLVIKKPDAYDLIVPTIAELFRQKESNPILLNGAKDPLARGLSNSLADGRSPA